MSGDLIDPAHQSRDMRLITTAIRRKWDLPDDIKTRLPADVLSILEDPEASTRDRLAAIKLLMTMVQQNEKSDANRKRRVVRHIHTVEPVTDANLDQRKADAARRIAEIRNLTAGSGGSGADAGGSGGGSQSV